MVKDWLIFAWQSCDFVKIIRTVVLSVLLHLAYIPFAHHTQDIYPL